ncbi:MAG: methyl-accepting chemotaxis protein [Comamonadaceae bacterium]
MRTLINNLNFITKLSLLTLVSVFILVAVSTYILVDERSHMRADRENLVRQMTEAASGVLNWAYDLETSGKMPRGEAQAQAKNAIVKMRYGNDEYIFVSDMQSPANILVHPKTELLGKPIQMKIGGTLVLDVFAQKVRKDKGGFLEYLWPKPGKTEPVEKVSYVQGFEPWGWVIGTGLYVDDLQTEFISIASKAAIVAILGAMGLLYIAFIISRSITRGVAKAVQVVDAIAQGDLTKDFKSRGSDEIAKLLNALMLMQSSLLNMVSAVRSDAESLSVASAQIAQGNHDLSARTESQASALEQTAASMEQMGSTISQNADSAHRANQLALSASTIAAKGGIVVSEVVGTMQGINEASHKIAEIIGVIDGIAFQTNILALNAAVEAARAGEQGRGFAVVASEVRSLAGRSADAAKEIKMLISASVERVEQGAQLVDRAGETMTEVVNSIKRVTDIIGEINSASTEQAEGVHQVVEAVSQMDQATQQNAALVEEMSAAAMGLKAQAQGLVKVVAMFNLGTTRLPNASVVMRKLTRA